MRLFIAGVLFISSIWAGWNPVGLAFMVACGPLLLLEFALSALPPLPPLADADADRERTDDHEK